MKKNTLWWIIGLMSVALVGVVLLQAYWINQSIQLSEERFDKNVMAALQSVSTKLEQAEVVKTTSGLLPQSFDHVSNRDKKKILAEMKKVKFGEAFSLIDELSADTFLVFENSEQIFSEKHPDDCSCETCKAQLDEHLGIYYDHFTKAYTQRSTCNKPILQRFDIYTFDELLGKELKHHGIDIDYTYGVYSTDRRSFVLINAFAKSKKMEKVVKASSKNLSNSNYRTPLFPADMKTPGYLLIDFPGKVGYMWRSVMPMTIGSILFSSIIIFGFAYTVKVIFEQKKLSEIKNDFINNMTHEFKTPIATISLAADSINSPMLLGKPDKVARFANIIKAENDRMNKQVEKVLQMALLDKNEVNLNLKTVNLHEIIAKAVDTISLQVEKKDGQIVQDLRATDPFIEADETHISNVIHNLLDNANKYTPEKPEISIHTRNVNGGVQVMVKDNGIGMSKEQRKKIFDKFYRVPTGNRHDVKGFGLGLSYVKAIVTEHKGEISVRSELGKGSRFFLFFKHQRDVA